MICRPTDKPVTADQFQRVMAKLAEATPRQMTAIYEMLERGESFVRLTASEAASILREGRTTFYERREMRKLTVLRDGHRSVFYRSDEIYEVAEGRRP